MARPARPDRCDQCKRGNAGFMDSEKTLDHLDPFELDTERDKYIAKIARIDAYMTGGGPIPANTSAAGKVCDTCGHGWREFQAHVKDLSSSLTWMKRTQHRAARGSNLNG